MLVCLPASVSLLVDDVVVSIIQSTTFVSAHRSHPLLGSVRLASPPLAGCLALPLAHTPSNPTRTRTISRRRPLCLSLSLSPKLLFVSTPPLPSLESLPFSSCTRRPASPPASRPGHPPVPPSPTLLVRRRALGFCFPSPSWTREPCDDVIHLRGSHWSPPAGHD
ncbi:hypothetical protein Mapa_001695 [Marchantia paleacea]|nr:hypothetical protein Mapa_001695 [Marchantia paleacea]